MMKPSIPTLVAAALAVALASVTARADPAPHAGPAPPRAVVPHGPVHLDQQYRHDHYYPAAGFAVNVLPAGSVSIAWRDGRWYFHGGVWFRAAGSRFVVAAPLPGMVTPVLPPAYVPLWVANAPYYYANGIYYSPVPEGFAVVSPPAGATAAQPLMLPPSFVIYPRQGQGAAQMDADRAACNAWAATQGANTDPYLLQRAFEACMDGRGYSVR